MAIDEDDGMISREIPALENKGLRLAAARESLSGSPTNFGLEMKGKLDFSKMIKYIFEKKSIILYLHTFSLAISSFSPAHTHRGSYD